MPLVMGGDLLGTLGAVSLSCLSNSNRVVCIPIDWFGLNEDTGPRIEFKRIWH